MKPLAKWTRPCNRPWAECWADSAEFCNSANEQFCNLYLLLFGAALSGFGQITKLHNYQISMSRFAEPMTRLIDELKKLPGVGSKSAQRLAFHILRSSEDDAASLAAAIQDV